MMFDRMASDDQDERIASMEEVLSALTSIMGLGGSLATVTVFLTAPFELPKPPDTPKLRSDDAHQADEHSDLESEEDPAADENTGLETVNSSVPLVVGLPDGDATQFEAVQVSDKQPSSVGSETESARCGRGGTRSARNSRRAVATA